MLGVCESLAEDFALPPTLIRVAFAIALFLSPAGALGGYAFAGLLVALSRWLVPEPAPAEPEAARAAPANDGLQERGQARAELAHAA